MTKACLFLLSVGMENIVTTVKDCLAVSFNSKYTTEIRLISQVSWSSEMCWKYIHIKI